MAIYLDYNASSPIHPDVLELMMDVYKNYIGNADSRTHDFGNNANKIVADARAQVASLLGVKSDEVFFTSGSTESDNIAIQGLRKYGLTHNKKHIITTSIEHKAVLETAKAMQEFGFEVDFIDPEENGIVPASKVLEKIRPDTLLVSVMHVNNETGMIQPVHEIGSALKDKDIYFHVDATQSCGKLVNEIRNLDYDMLSIASHKMRGPQGIGALVLKRKRFKLPPIQKIMYGGDQEHGIRPGTTPVALVAGFGKACEIAENTYQQNEKQAKEIKTEILNLLKLSGLEYKINGEQEKCISSTINLALTGVNSEALMIAAKQFVGISNGSACTSHSYAPSYVLRAMGIPDDLINCSIRLSWGSQTNIEDVKLEVKSLLEVAKGLVF